MNPFQLSEICQLIARHLSQSDLALCSLVCQDWKSNFTPLLWRTVLINGNSYTQAAARVPTREAQAVYGHLIRKLDLCEYPTSDFPLLQCPNLSSLSISLADDLAASTLSLKPRLTRLKLRKVQFLDSVGFWEVASQKLTSLRHLDVSEIDFDPNAIKWFWNTCSRLETLNLADSGLPKPPDTSLIFPEVNMLRTSNLRRFSEHDLQVLISRCPNLKCLASIGIHPGIPNVMFSSHVVQECWPMLESLKVIGTRIQDRDLARILGGMRSVKILVATMTGFGPLSFAALRPHFHELEILGATPITADKSNPINGAMALEILASCPNLRKFTRIEASAEELLADRTPWVSTKLTFLSASVNFPFDCDPSLHRFMFDQLSRLTSLKSLNLYSSHNHHALDFRLSRGMAQLKGLTQLNHITLFGTTQQMEKEDVQWLLDNMKSLVNVTGDLNRDSKKARELDKMCKTLENRLHA